MLEFPVEHVGATLKYSQPFSVAVSLGWLKKEGLWAETASPVLEERWHPDTAAAQGKHLGACCAALEYFCGLLEFAGDYLFSLSQYSQEKAGSSELSCTWGSLHLIFHSQL